MKELITDRRELERKILVLVHDFEQKYPDLYIEGVNIRRVSDAQGRSYTVHISADLRFQQ